jgi:pyridoxal phosphate enzyme (YggS family)
MLQENLNKIIERIERACLRANRQPKEVNLLAVTKKQPDQLIEEAYSLGLRDFGENYVQELAARRERLSHLKDARWHLIGPLQRNKVKQALALADYFHALDSEKIAIELNKRFVVTDRFVKFPVFLEVNVDRDPEKHGFEVQNLPRAYELISSLEHLKVMGLMCVPKQSSRVEDTRVSFSKLKSLANNLALPELSMGMSHDFEVAIEEGATWIRVGSLLFGERRKE